MEQETPKKIYTSETAVQTREDLINSIKKIVSDFSDNSNATISIDYDMIGFWVDMDITS